MKTAISFDYEVLVGQMAKLVETNRQLRASLAKETERRIELEQEIERLNSEVPQSKPKSRRRTPPKEYTPFKSNGHRKATGAEPINSYSDFKAIADWFWDHQQYRNWALWWCGISFGLRFSDLVALRWGQVMDENGEFRERVLTYESKTSKLQNCLITEAVVFALTTYIHKTKFPEDMSAYIFPGATKGKGDGTLPITTSQGCKILKAAGDECDIDFHLSTHTMRKSMVNIACCVGSANVDFRKLELARGLLNHSGVTTTMRYMDKLVVLYDRARTTVSDFLMRKIDDDKLEWRDEMSLDDVMKEIKSLHDMLEGSGAD